jgi:hypothetical protein
MNVIGHNHRRMQKMLDVVVMKTGPQCDRASRVRQNPSLKGTERNEMTLIISLQMWQFPSVEHNSRSDSRLGCPAKAKPSGSNPKA